MRVSRPYNISLLRVIAEAKEITYDDLKRKYLPPKQPGIIQGAEVTFDSDLDTLEAEGFISRHDDLICYIER